jgi:hypothetical protein
MELYELGGKVNYKSDTKSSNCIVQKYNILDIYLKIISNEECEIQMISMNIN